ncbi:MAG: hypothetical protein LBK99_15545 [Opitutaceae bacterium]|nr:hypothetical protein [Opitutaceae bacterium]
MEDCVGEVDSLLRLICDSYQEEIGTSTATTDRFIVGLTILRQGAMERLRNAADAIIDEHFKLTAAACEGKGGRK